MTLQLSPAQSALWLEGAWASYRIEEDVIEQLDRDNITDLVIVILDNGTVAFGVWNGEVEL